MEYLADTVAIIRYFSGSGYLPKKVKEIFLSADEGENVISISIISIVEIMYLAERNKIKLNLGEFKKKIENNPNYRIIDLDFDIIEVAKNIDGLELHDRLIVSTAKYLEIPIITSDEIITDSKIIEVIWK